MKNYDYDDFDIFEDYDFDDVERKKKGKLWALILAVILAVAAVVGVFAVVFNGKDKNAESLIQEGLVMYEEPNIRLEPQGLRFRAMVSSDLKEKVESDENKTLGMVVAPLTYFLQVDLGDDSSQVDWMNEFSKAGLAVMEFEEIGIVTNYQPDGTVIGHYMQCSLTELMYNNTNRVFMAFAFVKTVDGEDVSYKYASYPEGVSYKTQGRSLAYLAAEALNDKEVNYTYYATADVELMQSLINRSVDFANGLSEPTNDGSTYTVTLSETQKTMALDEQFTLTATLEEKVTVPVWWVTDNARIVTIINGVITAVGKGTTTVYAVVAGEKYACEITVGEENIENENANEGKEATS